MSNAADIAARLLDPGLLAPLRYIEMAMSNYASVSRSDAAALATAGVVRITGFSTGNRAYVKLTDFGRAVLAA